MTRDKIYIIGKGAIGKALAVFLTLKGKDVTLIRGSVDDSPHRTEHLEVTLNNGSIVNADVGVGTLNSAGSLKGVVVLTNKSFGNPELAKKLKEKISGSPVIILQNGLGVERPFIHHDFPSVYRGVLFVTSQNLDRNGVRFKPVSFCPVGIVKGHVNELNDITENLSTEHFQFRPETDINPVIWKKAIINCAFNSICPLLEVDNGVFHRNAEALAIARRIVDECVAVAAKNGIVLDAPLVMENLLLISRSSDGQLISTLQDIRNHQPTEIDTLNLEIARIAEEHGMEHHVRETKLLGELTRLKSALSMEEASIR
jgi:2-dehydropantoate 2-reductase